MFPLKSLNARLAVSLGVVKIWLSVEGLPDV
jgi:hypothetical protein